jgi:hypothetical protein
MNAIVWICLCLLNNSFDDKVQLIRVAQLHAAEKSLDGLQFAYMTHKLTTVPTAVAPANAISILVTSTGTATSVTWQRQPWFWHGSTRAREELLQSDIYISITGIPTIVTLQPALPVFETSASAATSIA